MKYLKKNGNTIVTCLVELLIGILLFIDPIRFTSAILLGIGIVLLACGLYCVLRYFRTKPAQAVLEQNLAKGLIMILLGAFLAFWTERALALFPLVTNLYGIVILLLGVIKFQQSVDLVRLKARYWFLSGINALLAIGFAVLILANPFASTVALWKLCAISLIVEAVMDIVVLIFIGKQIEAITKTEE